MIYIKTEMKEMPKECDDCVYCKLAVYEFWCTKMYRALTDKEYIKSVRPKWCPLIEIKEADK